MRWTKIVATVGPATRSPERLRALIEAGVDVIRLNFSHGNPQEHWQVLGHIRQIEAELGRPIAILQDLPGPKIRVGELKQDVYLQEGQNVTLTGKAVAGEGLLIPCTYEDIAEDVRSGDRILLNDGRICLRVQEVSPPEVVCRVMDGGLLSSHKGVNLPDTPLRLPSLTERDHDFLCQGVEHQVDYIAISFVRTGNQMREACRLLGDSAAKLIAKIEKPEAVEHLDEILQASDGVMVARGDLGVEIPIQRVPLLQKRIIDAANEAGVLVITATQMLDTMTHEPMPTRAEATDVANAVLDGTDALMLSGETAVGEYPVQTVRMMDRIIREAEAFLKSESRAFSFHDWRPDSLADAVAFAACSTGQELRARAIVPFTRTGTTARFVSKLHPRLDILAFTPKLSTWRQMALFWGVEAHLLEPIETTEEMVRQVGTLLEEQGLAQPGDILVLLAGAHRGMTGPTNLMRLLRVGEPTPGGD